MRFSGLSRGLVGLLLAASALVAVEGGAAASTSTGQALDDPRFNGLAAVASIGPDDMWAVGTLGPRFEPVAVHWNGQRWTPYDIPAPHSGFESVTAIATDDVWAVGFDYSQFGKALIEHWDGTTWTRVDAPTEPGGYFDLTSVGYVSPDDVYAFGRISNGANFDDTITLHWDGKQWSEQDNGGGQIEALDASSPTDAWRVGRSATGKTLTQHWDGTSWSTVPSPSIGSDNDLVSVQVLGPNDAWAAGDAYNSGTYTEHWNGKHWKLIRDVQQQGGVLLSLNASSSTDIWITGTSPSAAILEHWDGRHWAAVADPVAGLPAATLEGVTALSPTDAWAVGYYFSKLHGITWFHRILLHWDGANWTRYQQPGK